MGSLDDFFFLCRIVDCVRTDECEQICCSATHPHWTRHTKDAVRSRAGGHNLTVRITPPRVRGFLYMRGFVQFEVSVRVEEEKEEWIGSPQV